MYQLSESCNRIDQGLTTGDNRMNNQFMAHVFKHCRDIVGNEVVRQRHERTGAVINNNIGVGGSNHFYQLIKMARVDFIAVQDVEFGNVQMLVAVQRCVDRVCINTGGCLSFAHFELSEHGSDKGFSDAAFSL